MVSTNKYDIAVIGDWHLAFVTASVLADCGHKVALVNHKANSRSPLPGQSKNEPLWSDFPPIPVMEPGLNEMIANARAENLLHFENGVTNSWAASHIWMAVDTPVNDQDEPNVEPLLEIVNQIKKHQPLTKNFIISSQVPLGFGDQVYNILKIPVSYVPENLRLGKGIDTFLRADRTVIGSTDPESANEVKNLMVKFETQFLLTNLITSEMVKHANNIFLATSISFANELSRLGEKFNVDSMTVGKALRLDKRIGSAAYVLPGLGFAGGTLPRDLRVVQKIGKTVNVPTPLVDAVLNVNENTTIALAEIIQDHISKNQLPKKVLLLGYTYKADTDTLRRSLTIDLAKLLSQQGIAVSGYDSVMNSKDLSELDGIIQHNPTLDFKEKFSAVICMTARPTFANLDWSYLVKSCSKSCLILDTQNILNSKQILSNNLWFQQLWAPIQKQKEVASTKMHGDAHV
jgi:UDPglucose 6-dehydrogenase